MRGVSALKCQMKDALKADATDVVLYNRVLTYLSAESVEGFCLQEI